MKGRLIIGVQAPNAVRPDATRAWAVRHAACAGVAYLPARPA
jgi:hypothetical protein